MRLAVISQSARIYAHFAREAGHQVYAVDGFADADLMQTASQVMYFPPIVHGIRSDDLDTLIDVLDSWQIELLVFGSGFEHDNAAYTRLFARYPVAGNTPDWLNRVKQPLWLAQVCREANVAIPAIRESAPSPASGQRWLIKKQGGCGGVHIRAWQPGACTDAQSYYQAWQPGVSVGALCIGNGQDCQLIGVHRLHQNGFAYAGATSWPEAALKVAMQQMLLALYAHMPLVGIFSLDARWYQGQLYLLEVNPRLSASMRIYAALPLMQAHLSACKGQPLVTMALPESVASHRIVYARERLSLSASDLPIWVEDRPTASVVAAGMPVCSLYASAESQDNLQQQLLYQYDYLKEKWGSYVSEYIECND